MRKHYIDNLRNMAILLLFPVHTFMIWNNFGSRFYIWLEENKILSTLIVLVNPWVTPLLFVLAGMNAGYALEKRTTREFLTERVKKLLVPFLAGMVFLVPFQTLYARKYFNHYTGSLCGNWKYFFTHLTDFNGYDGAFTPGHLWFILFLFIITIIGTLVFHFLPYKKVTPLAEKISAFGVLFFFLPIGLMFYLGNFGGKSIGKSLSLYLLGYYVLRNDSVMETLDKNRKWLTALCITGTILSGILYHQFSCYGDWWVNYTGWNTILVLLVLGRRYLNQETGFTIYFRKRSYMLYILHQTILVALAYYTVQASHNIFVQITVICFGSFLLTVPACSLINRVKQVTITIRERKI